MSNDAPVIVVGRRPRRPRLRAAPRPGRRRGGRARGVRRRRRSGPDRRGGRLPLRPRLPAAQPRLPGAEARRGRRCPRPPRLPGRRRRRPRADALDPGRPAPRALADGRVAAGAARDLRGEGPLRRLGRLDPGPRPHASSTVPDRSRTEELDAFGVTGRLPRRRRRPVPDRGARRGATARAPPASPGCSSGPSSSARPSVPSLGMGRLPELVAASLPAGTVRLGVRVRERHRLVASAPTRASWPRGRSSSPPTRRRPAS